MNKIKLGESFTNNQGCRAVVVENNGCMDIIVSFNGHEAGFRTTAQQLRSGEFKNPLHPSVLGVGYLGLGEFKPTKNGRMTKEYQTWRGMLVRCYDRSYQEKNKTYLNCTVAEDWLDFQKFSKWFSAQKHPKSRYDLDKDLLFQGNKVYSAETCCLLPQELNKLIVNRVSEQDDYPAGVDFHARQSSFRARIKTGEKSLFLGYFKTAQEAHQAYVVAKEAYVKEVANKWRGRIDERVYDALMDWRVTQ